MSRILDKLADQHEERLLNVLYTLEDDVINSVRRSTGGELISTRLAIQLQPQLRQAMENIFLNEADLLINEDYNKIAKEVGFLDALNMADHIEKLLINLNVGYHFDDISLTQDWTSLLREMSNPSRMLNNIINFNEKDIFKIVSKSLVKLSNK